MNNDILTDIYINIVFGILVIPAIILMALVKLAPSKFKLLEDEFD